jgi:hypothetical protein
MALHRSLNGTAFNLRTLRGGEAGITKIRRSFENGTANGAMDCAAPAVID